MTNIRKSFDEALASLNLRDLRKAEDGFRGVLRSDPSHVPALNLLTVILMSMGRFADAEPFIARAVRLNPNSDVSFYNYGLIAKQLNKLQLAYEQFTAAINLDPKVPDSWNNRGAVCNDLGKYELAISDFNKAIDLNHSNAGAFANKGRSLLHLKRYDAALAAYDEAVSINPHLDGAWLDRAVIFRCLKRYDEALASYVKALSIKADLELAWLGCADVFCDLKRYDDALAAYDRALSIKPDLEAAWLGRADVFCALKRYDDAFSAYAKALSIKPDLEGGLVGRGNVFFNLKKYQEASAAYDKALSIKPDLPGAWVGRGNVFWALKRYDEAFAAYDKALSINPDLESAWLGQGNMFCRLKHYNEALVAYDRALSIKPDLDGAWLGRGNVFCELKRYDDAFAAYDKALSIKPDSENAQLGRGNVFQKLHRNNEALVAYEEALAIKPDLEAAWLGRGSVFCDLKRHDEAFAAYDQACSIEPDIEGVEGLRLHMKMNLCNWKQLDKEIESLVKSVRSGKTNCPPFALLSLTDCADDHLLCAQALVSATHPVIAKPLLRDRINKHDKIRVGYVSADLHAHATASLVAELFELHNKEQFYVAAFSLGSDDQSDLRRRLVSSFDHFMDCQQLSDFDVARAIADCEIDILVDLKGFTQDGRTSIFGYRPAPIQVNYLGYPGTIGAPYVDYIIGDKTLFTPIDQRFYSEKLVQLPNSYQPNDRKRRISSKALTRQEAGLPDGKFVFCCFNNNYKILPRTFDSWMGILERVEGSVLWLLAENQTAMVNLKKEAESRGVSSARLVFAHRVQLSHHLARHHLADLFLDTLPCTAHTTASDALWAGLPLLTQIGSTFAGRVAASLLNAIGLPELITKSRDEYETLAVELALNPVKLKNIREKLHNNRLTAPLFDTPLYTRHLEAAYEAMYQRHRAGLSPDHIEISQTGPPSAYRDQPGLTHN